MSKTEDWLITVAVAIVAYWLGYQRGWKACDHYFYKTLNRLAYRLGVPADDPFWIDHHE
jgi:hypothetical protein